MSLSGYAQLNNAAFETRQPVKPDQTGELQLGLNVLGYQKNNEYFNDIAEGYTLFGYHLNPRLIYHASPTVRLDVGVQVQKDFGTKKYSLVQPTFTLRYEENGMALLLGTLEGHLNHGYIEPLYDFERVMTNRLENGLQFLLDKPGTKVDVWIDWQRYLRRLDPFQEEVAGGVSSEITLYRTPVSLGFEENTPETETYIGLPLQFTAQHRGGQIDDTDLPLVTLANVAAGLVFKKSYDRKVLKALHFQPYVVGWKDFSNEKNLAFTQGGGLYLNAGVDTKYQNVMLSYWRGNGYYSELGGKLFPSVSSNFKTPDYTQKNRQLLILRFMHDIKLMDGLDLTLRVEPYYDLDFPKLEFSNSLYLNFNSDFFLAKPKRR
ncbi:hypothetical protein TH63_01480 [Rufibacter radiotolerans]|uniref:Uncharacterized protein n=1 Tax=Rufibacter radiotolerans TaxID=1379910 RepID=A0A0H4VQ30_9BACT|nr:hypothetical protein TH63_01480 [Rufibacter radiotolerans]